MGFIRELLHKYGIKPNERMVKVGDGYHFEPFTPEEEALWQRQHFRRRRMLLIVLMTLAIVGLFVGIFGLLAVEFIWAIVKPILGIILIILTLIVLHEAGENLQKKWDHPYLIFLLLLTIMTIFIIGLSELGFFGDSAKEFLD